MKTTTKTGRGTQKQITAVQKEITRQRQAGYGYNEEPLVSLMAQMAELTGPGMF